MEVPKSGSEAKSSNPFPPWSSYRALLGAWRRVREKNPAPGSDGIGTRKFQATSAVELEILRDQILSGRYQPQPLACFEIPKPSGGTRIISIPSIRDRVVQGAILGFLEPRIEGRLGNAAHGYRKGCSALTAQRHAASLVTTGLRHYLHADIEECFGSVDRAGVRSMVAEISDELTAEVVDRSLGVPWRFDEGEKPAPPRGIPLGLPLSPPLLNLFLSGVDKSLEQAGCRFIRYADDFLLLGESAAEVARAKAILEQALASLQLRLNAGKSRRGIIPGDPVPFLGNLLAGDKVLAQVEIDESGPTRRRRADNKADGKDTALQRRTLYLQTRGAFVRARKGIFEVSRYGEHIASVRARDIDQVCVLAPVTLTSGVINACLSRGVAIHFLIGRGRVFGSLLNTAGERPQLLRAQVEAQTDPAFRLETARTLVQAKIRSQQLLLRQRRAKSKLRGKLNGVLQQAQKANGIESLLGVEGAASRLYFTAWRGCISQDEMRPAGRTRRPPRDPVNSLLSFGYTLLLNEVQGAIIQAGLSPYIGYLHSLRVNHPTLASDLMEEFRAPVVDRFVLSAVNRGQFVPEHFETSDKGAVYLRDAERKRFLQLWEDHLEEPLRHDPEGRPRDVRSVLRLQVRRFRDYLLGNESVYRAFALTGDA